LFTPCPPSMDIIGLRGPTWNFRDFPLFHVSPSFKHCPTARCVTATNSGCSNFGTFRRHIITNMLMLFLVLLRKVSKLIIFVAVFLLFHMSCLSSCTICVRLVCCYCSGPTGCWLSALKHIVFVIVTMFRKRLVL
jgi:hypothetical protein